MTKLVTNMHAIPGNTSNTPSQTLVLPFVNYKLPIPSNSQLSYATTPSQSPVLLLTPLNIVPARHPDSSSIKGSLMHATLIGLKRLIPEEIDANDLYDISAGKKNNWSMGMRSVLFFREFEMVRCCYFQLLYNDFIIFYIILLAFISFQHQII